ncbi:hypothetical protein HYH03_002474 [Edaphochlamys debaryana]|uniref:Histone H4 n=1 Tax=Edaphochlamys debaryana TaxID=47281 RepID=A0A836C522_9CHLO|nr:hypothetical protein HYH03_002474 [Edaphochlamys debaryana]|eukprot:KAG2499528.1 hypothetical protein HYH03_002474 [Edaphochlamys debaryana]
MSGRGKGGKGLGKGGAKRHRKVLRDNIQGITKPAIRRLARRGGVKRISGLIYEETRTVLKTFLENVIRDSVTYTEHARRKTVTAMDVVYALKRQGRTLYGFDLKASLKTTTHDEIIKSIRGCLARGLRPRRLALLLGDWRAGDPLQLAEAVLQAFFDVTAESGSPMPTSELVITAALLSPPVLQAITAALPALSSLTVYDITTATFPHVAALLACGVAGDANSCQGPQPLVAALHELCLRDSYARSAPLPPMGPLLRDAAQLRVLEVHMQTRDAHDDAHAIARLTQLEGLRVMGGREEDQRLGAALLAYPVPELTRLTSLSLGVPDGTVVSPTSLTALRGLQDLYLMWAVLDTTGLEALTALTHIHVGSLALPTPEGGAASARPDWRSLKLPPRLEQLDLHSSEVPLELVSHVRKESRRPDCREYAVNMSVGGLVLSSGTHIVASEGTLKAKGEASLCNALSFLYCDCDPVRITAAMPAGRRWLKPCPTGTGSHERWLRAIRPLEPSALTLTNIALSTDDLRAIAKLHRLETLELRSCSFPVYSLPVLYGLPSLSELTLDIRGWFPENQHEINSDSSDDDEEVGWVPAGASGALVAFLHRFNGDVVVEGSSEHWAYDVNVMVVEAGLESSLEWRNPEWDFDDVD